MFLGGKYECERIGLLLFNGTCSPCFEVNCNKVQLKPLKVIASSQP